MKNLMYVMQNWRSRDLELSFEKLLDLVNIYESQMMMIMMTIIIIIIK